MVLDDSAGGAVVELSSSLAAAPVDVSIPYDAAARLAYESTDKSMPFETFKVIYEEQAIADVKAKQAKRRSGGRWRRVGRPKRDA